jgi:hypothetical protein
MCLRILVFLYVWVFVLVFSLKKKSKLLKPILYTGFQMVLSWEGQLEPHWQTMSRRLRTDQDARIIRLDYDSILAGIVRELGLYRGLALHGVLA